MLEIKMSRSTYLKKLTEGENFGNQGVLTFKFFFIKTSVNCAEFS